MFLHHKRCTVTLVSSSILRHTNDVCDVCVHNESDLAIVVLLSFNHKRKEQCISSSQDLRSCGPIWCFQTHSSYLIWITFFESKQGKLLHFDLPKYFIAVSKANKVITQSCRNRSCAASPALVCLGSLHGQLARFLVPARLTDSLTLVYDQFEHGQSGGCLLLVWLRDSLTPVCKQSVNC